MKTLASRNIHRGWTEAATLGRETTGCAHAIGRVLALISLSLTLGSGAEGCHHSSARSAPDRTSKAIHQELVVRRNNALEELQRVTRDWQDVKERVRASTRSLGELNAEYEIRRLDESLAAASQDLDSAAYGLRQERLKEASNQIYEAVDLIRAVSQRQQLFGRLDAVFVTIAQSPPGTTTQEIAFDAVQSRLTETLRCLSTIQDEPERCPTLLSELESDLERYSRLRGDPAERHAAAAGARLRDEARRRKAQRSDPAWLKASCENGTVDSCLRFGRLGEWPSTPPRGWDPAEGLWGFEQACQGGLGEGCYLAGRCYLEGKGAKRDLSKAAGLTRKGCKLGYTDACKERFSCEHVGEHVGNLTSMDGCKKLCRMGMSGACYVIARQYEEYGHDHKAAPYYKLACTNGDDRACDCQKCVYNGRCQVLHDGGDQRPCCPKVVDEYGCSH